MIRVEKKHVVAPPPIEITMTMDILTARAIKAAIQIATRGDSPTQTLSPDAKQRLGEVANSLYNKDVIIQAEDVVNKSSY